LFFSANASAEPPRRLPRLDSSCSDLARGRSHQEVQWPLRAATVRCGDPTRGCADIGDDPCRVGEVLLPNRRTSSVTLDLDVELEACELVAEIAQARPENSENGRARRGRGALGSRRNPFGVSRVIAKGSASRNWRARAIDARGRELATRAAVRPSRTSSRRACSGRESQSTPPP